MASELKNVMPLETGTFLDEMVGIGGLPIGRIWQIVGKEGLGKTTVCLQAIAHVQKNGGRCLFADVEWSFDPRYAEALGIDLSKLGIIREQFAEDVLDQVEEEVRKGDWDLIVFDSVGGVLPKTEAEKDAGGKTIGSQASMLARFVRKVVPLAFMNNVTILAINHVFDDIRSGTLKASGGQKWQYHIAGSIKLVDKYGANIIKQGKTVVGKVITAEVWKKNKVAGTEKMKKDVQIIFGKGFSQIFNLSDKALEQGIIHKTGNTYWYGKVKLGVGKTAMTKFLEENENIYREIKYKLI